MSCDDNIESGQSVYLQRGDGASPEVFTTLATVIDMDGFDLSADTNENTKRGPGVKFKSYTKGLIDGGELSATIESVPGQPDWDLLEGDVKNDICARNFRLVFPTDTYEIPALPTGFKPTYKMGETIRAEWKAKVSGEPTIVV